MTGTGQRNPSVGPLAACCAIIALIVAPAPGHASDTTAVENPQYGFVVALPSDCRHEEGPGTVDAVCSPDGEPRDPRVASRTLNALVLQVSAETSAADAGKTPSELAQQFTEAMFQAELPEAVCGESDTTRAKVQNVKATPDETRVVYSADVVCAGVRFLQVPQRTASVRYVIAPTGRYRLVARSTSEEFEKHKAKIEAFFASFAVTPAAK